MMVWELRAALDEAVANGLSEDAEVRVQIMHGDGNEVLIAGLTEVDTDKEDGEEFLMLTGDEDELVSSEQPVNGPLDLVEMDDEDDEDPDSRP